MAVILLKYLTNKRMPVVMGASDAIADPRFYLYNGAAVVVIDKSGATNWLS